MEINNNKIHKMDPDPFKVRLEFTKSDYVRMALMGVTILPIRILGKITAFTFIVLYCFLTGMMSCFVMAWGLACIGMIGWQVSRVI